MTPMEAILANTSANAWLMNLEGEVGVIAPGKLADIVIWHSDPLADITVLQRPKEISLIIKDGRIIDRRGWRFPPAERGAAARPDVRGGLTRRDRPREFQVPAGVQHYCSGGHTRLTCICATIAELNGRLAQWALYSLTRAL